MKFEINALYVAKSTLSEWTPLYEKRRQRFVHVLSEIIFTRIFYIHAGEQVSALEANSVCNWKSTEAKAAIERSLRCDIGYCLREWDHSGRMIKTLILYH
jgi:hypothetical protein